MQNILQLLLRSTIRSNDNKKDNRNKSVIFTHVENKIKGVTN